MGWCGLLRYGSSMGPGEQAGFGALARGCASPAPAAGRALRRVWGWLERGGSASSMASDAGESRRGAGSGAGCGEGRKRQGWPGRCRRRLRALGRRGLRRASNPGRLSACGTMRGKSAGRGALGPTQAAGTGAKRELVGGEDLEAGARRIGEHCRRGRGRPGSYSVAEGWVDRGRACGAVQVCEPVAGAHCGALLLAEGASGPCPPGCGACRVCLERARSTIRSFCAAVDHGAVFGLVPVEAIWRFWATSTSSSD